MMSKSNGWAVPTSARVPPRSGEGRAVQLDLRRAPDAAAATESPALQNIRPEGAGRPLDPDTRGFMSSRFGHDFAGVRVHSDDRAAASARALGAQAYTAGEDVVFAENHYRPQTGEGRRLIAHELTHVIQQRQGRSPRGPGIARSESLEREADDSGERVRRGAFASVRGTRHALASAAASSAPVLQLQAETKMPATAPPDAGTKPETALEQAQALVKQSPATVKDRATWILSAADQGFVTFGTTKARENIESIRDEKKIGNFDSKESGVPILEVEIGLAKHAAQRWIDAEGKGAKPAVQFFSMIRSDGDPHGTGKAVDITSLNMTSGVAATMVILNDLDKSVHGSYGLGFPFQGEFFDPADDLKKKKQDAEGNAETAAKPKTDKPVGSPDKPDAGAKTEEKTEAKPVTATIQDSVQKFAAHVYESAGTRAADGKWAWKDSIQETGAAYKHLKSDALKNTLSQRRKDGLSFVIFPDNDGHLHLDAR
jgi:uncharacterized protein DUF4157